jgi:hypothetical protein
MTGLIGESLERDANEAAVVLKVGRRRDQHERGLNGAETGGQFFRP